MSNLTPDDLLGRPDPASTWIKSSLSFANSNCVEVANLPGGQVGVRHSKDADGAVLRFTPQEWHAFIGGVQNGEFDSFGKLWVLEARRESALLNLAVDETAVEGPQKQFGGLRLFRTAPDHVTQVGAVPSAAGVTRLPGLSL